MPADRTEADPSVTPARAARAIIRAAEKASLATLLPDPAGWPFASMAIPATSMDGSPLIVLSDLAQHARNLAADARASLLIVSAAEDGNRQATPRVTLVGRAVKTSDPLCRDRYMARNPDCYLGVLADFHLYRFEIDQAHFIGGFAKARRMAADELLLPAPDLSPREAALKEALNRFSGDWTVVALDAEGIDLRDGNQLKRASLAKPFFDPNQFQKAAETILKDI